MEKLWGVIGLLLWVAALICIDIFQEGQNRVISSVSS